MAICEKYTDETATIFVVLTYFCVLKKKLKKEIAYRFRGSKDREGEMRYNPFRITPYLLKVQGTGSGEEEPCCLALAERIISGYEGAVNYHNTKLDRTYPFNNSIRLFELFMELFYLQYQGSVQIKVFVIVI